MPKNLLAWSSLPPMANIRVMVFGKGKDIWVRVRIRILDIKGNEKGYSLLWVKFTTNKGNGIW